MFVLRRQGISVPPRTSLRVASLLPAIPGSSFHQPLKTQSLLGAWLCCVPAWSLRPFRVWAAGGAVSLLKETSWARKPDPVSDKASSPHGSEAGEDVKVQGNQSSPF